MMAKIIGWIKRGALIVASLLLLGVAAFVVWGRTPLGPTDSALAALVSDDAVVVAEIDEHGDRWITFQPVDTEATVGFIFYPGGRVDPRSYAPLAHAIAADGALVVIVPMPLNLAFFAPMRATAVMAAHPDVAIWAVGGHSLGGAMAARYVYEDAGGVEGLVLWAAYPAATDDLSQRSDLTALSIHGTQDGLMTETDLAASRSLMPEKTCWVAIEGGNHAQFGDYGVQGRDNDAAISMTRQHTEVIEATSSFLMLLDRMAAGEGFSCRSIGDVR